MNPLRPAKSILLPSQDGRWTSQSPPGKTSTAAPDRSASAGVLVRGGHRPVAAQEGPERARRGRGCGRAGRRAARPRSRSRRRAAGRSPRGTCCRRCGCRPAAPGPARGRCPCCGPRPGTRASPAATRAAGSRGCSRGRGRRGRRSAPRCDLAPGERRAPRRRPRRPAPSDAAADPAAAPRRRARAAPSRSRERAAAALAGRAPPPFLRACSASGRRISHRAILDPGARAGLSSAARRPSAREMPPGAWAMPRLPALAPRSARGSGGWCARRARPGARARSRRASPGVPPAAPRRRGGAKPGGMSRSQLAPDEQRRGLELGEPGVEALLAVRLVEVDVARGGEEGDPGRARAVGATELVDGDRRRRPGRAAPGARTGPRTARARSPRAAGAGSRPAPAAAGARAAPARGGGGKASAGASRLRLATRSGSPKPSSSAIRPPIELPTRWARSIAIASM